MMNCITTRIAMVVLTMISLALGACSKASASSKKVAVENSCREANGKAYVYANKVLVDSIPSCMFSDVAHWIVRHDTEHFDTTTGQPKNKK